MDMRDTTPQAEAIQAEIYRQMSPERRVEVAWEMSLLAREFTLARIRVEHPGLPEVEVMQSYIREVLLPGNSPFKK
jgi:hypothetical protein